MRWRWWIAGLGLLLAGQVLAHTLSVSRLDIAQPQGDGPARVELDLSLRDLALTLPLDANRDEAITWGELQAQQASLQALVLANLRLATTGDCRLAPTSLATRRYDDGAYATLRFAAHCPAGRNLRVHYALLFDRDPRHRALVTLRRGGEATSAIARDDARDVTLAWDGGHPFRDYLREGIHHILIGYDHLAFLLSLLLPAALVRSGAQWKPSDALRGSVLRVLGLVTAFTLAHSITLGLAAVGWVRPASRWVEAAIALSVLLAALNNLRPVVARRLWLVAFAFGLIHGFGFAGALGELGLPADARLLALFGFNLGVELGQLAVVAILLPILFAVRHQPSYRRIAMPLASLMIAALAAWWLFQRIAG